MDSGLSRYQRKPAIAAAAGINAGRLAHETNDADCKDQLMAGTIPPGSRPCRQFLGALPGLSRIADSLHQALQPAMTQGSSPDRAFAEAAWMLGKALACLLDAAQCDDPAAFDQALAESDASTQGVAACTRDIRVAAATVEDLAADGYVARLRATGGVLILADATLTIIGADGTDEVHADMYDDGKVRLVSARVYNRQLPVDGRTQLDAAAALDSLADAYARAVPGPRPGRAG